MDWNKGEQEDWIYSIDYRLVAPEDEDEYLNMFTFSGWTHICSEAGMHLFKARPDTVPIYSDYSSKIDKFSRQGMYVNQSALFLVILSAVCWGLWVFGPQNITGIFRIVFLCLLVITIPAIMTRGAIQWRKVKERSDDE
ncbi:DUF2812 domain-containing protein [Metasolibacillus meyeri]|uniref:DUF2812 domain-containing protein n=1 Tax=Metasolibacillus meyeri TaxID=1071052 RepID=A0AAW9NMZ8_9BACL|nr:DUF2812 domain-containing protein [Metasolibacillus meyeri]MEC1178800.1 DUF2812 domain-containing protein [Metasolibacillus meyeri]